MEYTLSGFLILLPLMRIVASENSIVGTTKDCSNITNGQAAFAVKSSFIEACCTTESRKTSVDEMQYANRERCCIPPGALCEQDPSKTPCCNQLR